MLTTFSTVAQLQVFTVNVNTNDLVYDSVTNKIYASLPSSNGTNGNSIGIISPITYTLENTAFIGSEPTVLAISDNGQYIYSGFAGSSTVRRFDVATQTAGIQFGLGSDNTTGPNYAEDIEVMPGFPQTIAVARKNNGFSPRHEGVAIYDDNVQRPTTTPDHTGSNRIEFTGPNSLVGYNNETTEFGIRKLSVTASGVTNTSVTQNVMQNFYLDFSYHNNRMYSFDGKVVDVSGVPYLAGQFTGATGPSVYDTYYNQVAFASYSGSVITFKRYNPETFLLANSLAITQATGPVKSIITCGNGCYALNTANKVVIIKDSTLSTPGADSNAIAVAPNPTTGWLQVSGIANIAASEIHDLNGRVVMRSGSGEQVNVEGLESGLYVIRVSDEAGNVLVSKFVKK